jgi:hypothetical protein
MITMEWSLQQKVLLDLMADGLMAMLKPDRRQSMLEGSKRGKGSLNEVRAAFGLNPILPNGTICFSMMRY